MKSVLISIQPKWCELIANGKKTVEVRKTKPKLDTPFKVYIYCTRNKRQWLRKVSNFVREIFITENRDVLGRTDKVKSLIGDWTTFVENGGYNGKVIGEFVCDRVYFRNCDLHDYDTITLEELSEFSCVTEDDLLKYADRGNLYGWHISDLVIYDKPKELSEFFYACDKPKGTDCSVCLDHRVNRCKSIARPPQSWCYVEEKE